ncbi:MAG: hypothetical protein B0A82_14285 [Alkalinema sp. CACIAM 70d]|nr:MAG: hypothetical protein B0A82_14285 [Alkalinema sp. CACIAM 70d]
MKNFLLPGLLLGLTACGQTSQEKLTDALKTTRSWAATAQMVGEAWQQGNVPDRYTQQTLVKSQQEIDKSIQEINTKNRTLQNLKQTLQEMVTCVEQHDKEKITLSLQQIKLEQQQIEDWAKIQGEQS